MGIQDVNGGAGTILFEVTAGWRFSNISWSCRRAIAAARVVVPGSGVRVVAFWVDVRTV